LLNSHRLGVEESDLKPFLEEMTLEEALNNNKIFIVDLEVLNGIPCKKVVPKVILLAAYVAERLHLT
jgi:hypothetical protein